MLEHPHLLQALAFLGSSVLLVPVFQRLGLGSILGYLAAGILIGPQGAKLIIDVKAVQNLSEFGVVFLLFMIGLELQPKKLLAMKRTLAGFGGLQIITCCLALGALVKLLGASWQSAMVAGFALSLSSTAFALQAMAEKKVLNTEFGRSSFAILLMQDVAAIPALAIIPTLGLAQATSGHEVNWLGVLGIFLGLLIFNYTLMGPFLRQVAALRSRELFTGVTLTIVIGVAYLMEHMGISMALGAFLAGVLLSESEYRHELEADLEPFKGLLMGLFFISVGMSVNITLLMKNPAFVLFATALYMMVKGFLLYGVGRTLKLHSTASRNMAAYLAQGGEFAFVIFGVGQNSNVLSQELSDTLTLIVTLSMIISPFVIVANAKFESWAATHKPKQEWDSFEGADSEIIIAGFGRFGQIFGRILRAQDIKFTAIDHDPEQIELLRRFGNKVYYGDASRHEIMEAAGAGKAKYLIIAVDDIETSKKLAQMAKDHFKNLKIYARARNRAHVFDLLDIGIEMTHIRRETFESSLLLTRELLLDLGFPSDRARAVIERFHRHDELMMAEQYKVRHDQKLFLDTSRQGMQQLSEVLREDQIRTYIDAKDLPKAEDKAPESETRA
ncbi:monovalent cation:proton antiporter-2 (CPA2) family protein [Bdellovibrio sp. KM01]|uniref:monovalent cation:proton antiporter-2 (CPA2) family protein n=1 Tax=Bdellovibrio sp. KM01 TaxID=2748865 RepID=UPI0015E9D125|nr:monovalent cation:proton antiporter-2 (CPA2) family protein [Bdellovibrio sp. KM01]QLY24065.1 cation:proton antiporter [Bdellovibrio sp. KM01]